MDVPIWLWGTVFALILLMLAVDLFAHREAGEIGFKEAAIWSSIWVALGIGFGGFIWYLYGAELAQQYFSGFVIEKSLAVDNVFVWAIIFAAFSVPRKYQHRVLFLGVFGALVFRGIFISLGAVIIESFAWVLYLFAAFLIWTGIKMYQHRNAHFDVENSKFLKWFRGVVPSTDKFYGQKLFVKINGKRLATPLLIVLVMIEFTDIVFAVDSIPAIFAVTSEPFLVFTANAFAILGLRAMYFLLADLIHRFVYLKTGLALVLVWVGIKMAVHDFFKVPTTLSLGVISAIIAVSIIASLRATKGQAAHAPEVSTKFGYKEATEAEMAEAGIQSRSGK